MYPSTQSTVAKLYAAASRAIDAMLPRSQKRQAAGQMMDPLEARTLFSFDITGTAGDDNFTISVTDDHVIHLNNGTGVEIVQRSDEEFINVLGFGGNDRIWLQNTGRLKFSLFGHGGDDRFTVGNGDLKRDIRRNVSVQEANGENLGGLDTLFIDDSVSEGSQYLFEGSIMEILSLSSPTIGFSMTNEDRITLQGGLSNDIAEIRHLRANTTINMGAGDDLVDFGGPDHIVAESFPTGCVLDSGGGNDELRIDDASAFSHRNNINIQQVSTTVGEPRWMILDTVGVSRSFRRMNIKTHARADGLPETVTFGGRDCPGSFVTITGCDGPDLIQVGTFANPIFTAELFTPEIAVTPGPGANRLEVYESDDALGHSWKLDGDKLTSGILNLHNKFPVSGTAGTLDVSVRATRNADHFIIENGTQTWNVTLDGAGGDDVFEQSALRAYDLDDTFTGYVKFDGSAGNDSVILIDSEDAIDDVDEYFVSSRAIRKGDQGTGLDTIVEMSFIDRITLVCDNDPNLIKFDGAGLQLLEIDGSAGLDVFANQNEATGLPIFINSLAGLTRLYGGADSGRLSLNDSSGGVGNYDLGPADFTYTRDTASKRVEFSDMKSMEVFGSNQPNVATLRAKPTGATLLFAGNGGADTFIVGGGNLRGSGLAGTTIGGGDGADHIRFDDHLADHSSFAADTLTFEFQTVNKDGTVIAYIGFESQSVLTSGVNTSSVAFPNTVRVNATDIPTEIIDTPGDRDTIVEVGHGQWGLNQVFAPVTLTSTGVMELKVFDLLSTTDKQFVVGETKVTQNNSPLPLTINHSGLDGLSVFAGNTNDQVIVESVLAGTSVSVSGGGGDDSVFVGNGTFATIKGSVSFSGGAGGADKMVFSNLLDIASSPLHATIAGSTFAVDGGPTHQFIDGVEQVQAGLYSAAGANIDVDATTIPVTLSCGAADDRVTAKNLTGNITFNGGGEVNGDRIVIDDSATTTPDQYTFDGNTLRKNATGPLVTLNGVERGELQAGGGHNIIQVNSTSMDLRLFGNAGNDGINVMTSSAFVTINTGTELLNPPSNAPQGDSILVANGGKARMDQDDRIILLSVPAGGTLRIENNAVLCDEPTSFPLPLLLKGVIDLAGGALLYRNDGLNIPFRQWISAGYNGGSWTGTSSTGAIHTSLAAPNNNAAVGYGKGSEIAISSIGSFTIGADDVLVRNTVYGDADLNGVVNFDDYSRIDVAFAQQRTGWVNGDFDYNDAINFDDYSLIDRAFNTQDRLGSSFRSHPGAESPLTLADTI